MIGSREMRSRAPVFAFCVVEAIALPLLIAWGRGSWFSIDDWDFLSSRTAGNLGDLFRAHYDHWATVPLLAYRLLWWMFGLSYLPYQLLTIGSHLSAAALLRVLMRRVGVGGWMATIVASLFVFFGSGTENIFGAFQIMFVWAFVLGLGQLLLADHEGPLDRRDVLGLIAGCLGLLCSGVALTMIIVVGLAMLVRRGWRIALFHTGPLAALYLAWRFVAPTQAKGQSPAAYHSQTLVQVMRFVVVGVEAIFGRLGQLPGVGIALALVLVAGFVMIYIRDGLTAFRGRLAVPIALVAGAFVFLVVTGIFRAGQGGGLVFIAGSGAERARQSRYVYLGAAMVLPALAVAADAVSKQWRQLTVIIVALLSVGIVGNIEQFTPVKRHSYFFPGPGEQKFILAAPRLAVAHELPRSVVVIGPTIGWLVDSLPSGRIPGPGPLTPAEVAT